MTRGKIRLQLSNATEPKHSSLKFVTPAQRHTGQDAAILAYREKVYRDARNSNPQRWSRGTRNWKLEDQVWLNPEQSQPEALQQVA